MFGEFWLDIAVAVITFILSFWFFDGWIAILVFLIAFIFLELGVWKIFRI